MSCLVVLLGRSKSKSPLITQSRCSSKSGMSRSKIPLSRIKHVSSQSPISAVSLILLLRTTTLELPDSVHIAAREHRVSRDTMHCAPLSLSLSRSRLDE